MTDVRSERRGAVAVLTFDGEATLNAFSPTTWLQLDEALGAIEADDDTRSVVLTGAGRAFIAGADIRTYDGATVAAFTEFQNLVRRVTDRLAGLGTPTIAAVNGYALGGGLELALACDLLVAAPTARLGLPEITLGLLPGGGGTQRLTRLVGVHRAKRLILTGELIEAREASAWGIVSHLADDVLATALGLAQSLSARSAPALAVGKQLIDGALDRPLAEGLDRETELSAPLVDTPEGRQGISDFLTKRGRG